MSAGKNTSWDEFCSHVDEISDSEAEQEILHLSGFGRPGELIRCAFCLNYQNAVILLQRYHAAGHEYTVDDVIDNVGWKGLQDREKLMYLILHTADLTAENLSELADILDEEEYTWLSGVLYE